MRNKRSKVSDGRQNISPILHTSLGSMEGKLTIPVSADRCWDWKNTASVSPQLGQSLLDRGSCEQRKKTPR